MNQKRKAKAYIFGIVLWAWNSRNNIDVAIAVYDEKQIPRIISGPKGMSPEIKSRKINCSICYKNYEECLHFEGKSYDGKFCECLMDELEFINVTNVSKPEDSRSKVTDLLILNDDKSYIWHGFETSTDNQRFKHIELAQKNKYISEKAALQFTTFFCNTDVGVVKYPR